MQAIVDEYKFVNLFIDHHCRLISDTLAIYFERKKIYRLDMFLKKQNSYRAAVIAKVQTIYNYLVEKLYNLFGHFRDDYESDEMIRS